MAKPSKPTEWAEKIRELLEAADLSQVELANRLESDSSQGTVSQGTVSNWLRAAGNYAPSSRMFAQLGNVAVEYGLDPLWFWEQAGFDQSAAISLAEQMLKKMRRKAAPSEIVGIPLLSIQQLLQGEQEEAAKKRAYPLPANLLTNPLSTVAMVVGEEAAVPFAAGDVVVLDRARIDLQSLWNKVVLVHLDPSMSPTSIGIREWRKGLCMGVLTFSELAWDRYLWGAALGPLGSFKSEPIVIGYRHSGAHKEFLREHLAWHLRKASIGRAIEREFRKGSPGAALAAGIDRRIAEAMLNDPEPDEEGLYEREREAARKNIKPTSGCTVIGRMVAWFSAEAGEK